MNQTHLLAKLADVMQWSNETAEAEFSRIALMSRLKYDEYQDFVAGVRFAERLLDWIQQFPMRLRNKAYDFAKSRLVFISESEMHHFVDLFYPETVEPALVEAIAAKSGVHAHSVWSSPERLSELQAARRRTFERLRFSVPAVMTVRAGEDRWSAGA